MVRDLARRDRRVTCSGPVFLSQFVTQHAHVRRCLHTNANAASSDLQDLYGNSQIGKDDLIVLSA